MSETRDIVSALGKVLGTVTLEGKPTEDQWAYVMSGFLSSDEPMPPREKGLQEKVEELTTQVAAIEAKAVTPAPAIS